MTYNPQHSGRPIATSGSSPRNNICACCPAPCDRLQWPYKTEEARAHHFAYCGTTNKASVACASFFRQLTVARFVCAQEVQAAGNAAAHSAHDVAAMVAGCKFPVRGRLATGLKSCLHNFV